MTTLDDLVTDLSNTNPDLPLVFVTNEGEIGGGYHVTELKRADIHSIDCGGRISAWRETLLQLLDGNDREHMKVGKFIAIAGRSKSLVPGLSEGQLAFEYGPGNRGMRRYESYHLVTSPSRTELHLEETHAMCKPREMASTGCC